MTLEVPDDCPYCFHHGRVFLKHALQKLVQALKRGAGQEELRHRYGAADHQLRIMGVCYWHAGHMLNVIECTVLGLPIPDFTPLTRTMGSKERQLFLDSIWCVLFGVHVPRVGPIIATNGRPQLDLVA